MIRGDGYYWVKLNKRSSWVALDWWGGCWLDNYQNWVAHDDQVYQVNENRIPNPDELEGAEAYTESKESVEKKAIERLLSRDDLPTTITGLNFWLNNDFISKDAYFEILKTIKTGLTKQDIEELSQLIKNPNYSELEAQGFILKRLNVKD